MDPTITSDSTTTANVASETQATTATATEATATAATETATAATGTAAATTATAETTEAVASGAPESYADFTLPEGMTIDPAMSDEFKAYAKANNLPQDKAQEAVVLGTKLVQNTIKSFQDAHAAQVKQWAEQTKADPVVGGPKYDENVALALKAVADYGDADLKQVFETYGLGNNPAMVRFAYRIGKAMSEGGRPHGLGNEQPNASRTLAGALWGNDPTSANVKPS